MWYVCTYVAMIHVVRIFINYPIKLVICIMYVNVILENQYIYHGKAHFSLPLNNYVNALTV